VLLGEDRGERGEIVTGFGGGRKAWLGKVETPPHCPRVEKKLKSLKRKKTKKKKKVMVKYRDSRSTGRKRLKSL